MFGELMDMESGADITNKSNGAASTDEEGDQWQLPEISTWMAVKYQIKNTIYNSLVKESRI